MLPRARIAAVTAILLSGLLKHPRVLAGPQLSLSNPPSSCKNIVGRCFASTSLFFAEREGFEPSIQFYPDDTLAPCCFRPLSHLSFSEHLIIHSYPLNSRAHRLYFSDGYYKLHGCWWYGRVRFTVPYSYSNSR